MRSVLFFRSIRFLAPKRKCASCFQDQPLDHYHERFSNVCQHVQRTICNKCVYNTAKNLKKAQINCPEAQCKAKINVKQYLPSLATNIENESSDQSHPPSKNPAIERKNEFIWCAHEECGSGQFHLISPDSSPIVTCVLCKRQTCAIHHVKWHKGLTCIEYERQNQMPTDPPKSCPSCRTLVHQNPSSERAVCSKCAHEFCWQCLVDYKKIQRNGNRQHKSSCIHFNPEKKSKESKSSACSIL